MNSEEDFDQLLEQWSQARRRIPIDTSGCQRAVLDRIQPRPSPGSQPEAEPPRLRRLVTTTACAAAGIAKFLVLLRSSI